MNVTAGTAKSPERPFIFAASGNGQREVHGMKGFRIIVLALSVLCLVALPVLAGAVKKFDFKNDAPEAEAGAFSSLVGNWHIDRDGNRNVYAVDGRKWEQGLMAAGAKEKAKGLYGERYAEFLDNLEAYRYFPLTVNKEF